MRHLAHGRSLGGAPRRLPGNVLLQLVSRFKLRQGDVRAGRGSASEQFDRLGPHDQFLLPQAQA